MTNPAGNQVTAHFAWSEFRCECGRCTMPPEAPPRIIALARALEELRLAVGKPVRITSGYRCEAHNADVGGATQSQHLSGRAADIAIEGLSGEDIRRQLEALIAEGRIPEGGIGVASTWAHYDIRGVRRRWRY